MYIKCSTSLCLYLKYVVYVSCYKIYMVHEKTRHMCYLHYQVSFINLTKLVMKSSLSEIHSIRLTNIKTTNFANAGNTYSFADNKTKWELIFYEVPRK